MLTRLSPAICALLLAACSSDSANGGGVGTDASSAGTGGQPDAAAASGGSSGTNAGGTNAGGTNTGGTSSGGASTGGIGTGGMGSGGIVVGADSGLDGAVPLRGRPFPNTTATIAILTDQLPNLTAEQQQFVVDHYVGTEKQTLSQSTPLRALKPDFLVLHYHLSMWEGAPNVTFIIDGTTWGNDYPTVDTHEDWFWHNESNQRVASTADQKLLMAIANPEFQSYWADSLVAQVIAGDYDGIFFDSASPALLQGEVGGQDPRLAGTGARDSMIAELGNQTFIQAWEAWMGALGTALAAQGIPLIPNTSAFVTTWDNTNYSLTAGAFVEGFADPSWATSDWIASTNELLSLAAAHKILILQNYLSSTDDLAKRLYYLSNYLLVKGDFSYLEYFATSPLEWYPEWALDLGAPTTTGATVNDLAQGGVYRRDFERGVVLVNPTSSPVDVALGATFQRVEPQGGGSVDAAGTEPGAILTTNVTMVSVAAQGAEILLR